MEYSDTTVTSQDIDRADFCGETDPKEALYSLIIGNLPRTQVHCDAVNITYNLTCTNYSKNVRLTCPVKAPTGKCSFWNAVDATWESTGCTPWYTNFTAGERFNIYFTPTGGLLLNAS